MNIVCTFKSGEKKPLREIEKLVTSGQMVATKLDGTPYTFPVNVRSRSSVDFEKPSPYESNGKKQKPRRHKMRIQTSRKCVLCHEQPAYNRHHLVPRSMAYVRPDQYGKIWTCRDCHTDVHWFFTNQELAFEFWEIPKLRAELEERRKRYEAKMTTVK